MPTVESNRSAKSGMSKSAFVRSLPNRLPAKEVVELAKKEGLRLSDKYVYVVRSNARRKGGRRGRRRISAVVVVGKATGTEKEFRRLALDYVNGYREGGNARLGGHRDRERPTFVANEFRSMIDRLPRLTAELPDLTRFLLEYPKATLPNSTNFLYW